ncbi:hypothetical protein M770_03110 [Pseudomonas aeruginosa VRFPA03]|nr:hypothetical protein M770_03110 [Pseudomonas aeruginosa VRFPA03]
MRLKQLTNLNTLLLLTVCLALGITLWWSQRAMERPFQLLDQYLELSQRFDEQVARNVRQYLGSGDAVRQQAALQALESLAEALPELPPDLARTLAPSLAELREFSAGDLLAAGKLAGLAQRTAGATEEIQQLIGRLQQAARQSVEAMRSQVEHAERTAEQAGAAEGALDEVVAAIHTIGVMAERIAEGSTQQSQAVGEIRSHSERIHALGGENLRLIGHSREQGEQLRQLGGDLRTTVQAFRL